VLLTRRAAVVLLAAAGWTFYIWGFRLWVMWGDDQSLGFKVVHTVLAAVSVGFAVYFARLGARALRAGRRPAPAAERGLEATAPRA
jgi:uncharacterized membrane protein